MLSTYVPSQPITSINGSWLCVDAKPSQRKKNKKKPSDKQESNFTAEKADEQVRIEAGEKR